MSDAHPGPDAGHHPADAHAADPHAAGPDAAAHGDHPSDHGDGHDGHDGMGLGAIDWRMWTAGVLGVAAGLVVVAAFVMGTAGFG
jgi:hypothetical protein